MTQSTFEKVSSYEKTEAKTYAVSHSCPNLFPVLPGIFESSSNPGGGWRKIVLRGVLRRGGVETDTPGGGRICLSVTGCVHTNICGN